MGVFLKVLENVISTLLYMHVTQVLAMPTADDFCRVCELFLFIILQVAIMKNKTNNLTDKIVWP